MKIISSIEELRDPRELEDVEEFLARVEPFLTLHGIRLAHEHLTA